MLAAAMVVIVLLLPIGGTVGDWLAGAAGWAMAVPIGGVFRGLLIGVAVRDRGPCRTDPADRRRRR